MQKYLFPFLAIVLIYACTPVAEKHYLKLEEVRKTTPEELGNNPSACHDHMNYIPDTAHIEHTPLRRVLVNFHIMRRSDGTGNFKEDEIEWYIDNLMFNTNKKLEKNQKMKLPVGNNTPVFPTRYRFELYRDPDIPDDDGIYFHNDDELYYFVKTGKNRNNYVRKQFEKYGIYKGRVLNIFVMPHHPDSVASPTYRPTVTGISFSDHVKIAGMHHSANDTVVINGKMMTRGAWFCHGIMNHELGHTLGLYHTWKGQDGCDDTPIHNNCYARDKKPPCDKEVSNNVMDYNTHQNSWTPCQLGIVHKRFSDKNSPQRKLLKPTWCEIQKGKDIVVDDQVIWRGAKDLVGNLTIADGGSLTIQCRVSMPRNALISVKPGGKLILDGATIENSCGDQWQGIEVWKEGKSMGEVVFVNDPELLNMKSPLK